MSLTSPAHSMQALQESPSLPRRVSNTNNSILKRSENQRRPSLRLATSSLYKWPSKSSDKKQKTGKHRSLAKDRFMPSLSHPLKRASSLMLQLAASENREQEKPTVQKNPMIDAVKLDKLTTACGISMPKRIDLTPKKYPVSRELPKNPEKTLDAPRLVQDFYLNLLDWSTENIVAIALHRKLFLYNATSGAVDVGPALHRSQHICSVVFTESNVVATGSSMGVVELWDVNESCSLRKFKVSEHRVGSLSYTSQVLVSGSKSGDVFVHDVRVKEDYVQKLEGHSLEVCGIKCRDLNVLATGSNDNTVKIWDLRMESARSTLAAHESAVKALAWCPWQSSLLATGGGLLDRKIRFWNTSNDLCVNQVDTFSQVTSVVWDPNSHEILSAHGFPDSCISIWDYPSLVPVAEIAGDPGQDGRILYTALSPDHQSLAVASADGKLRFWKCFLGNSKKSNLSEQKRTLSIDFRPNFR